MHSVLVVDDERDIRESLRGVLEDEGYKVLLAESGEACLEQLKKRACEVVLLDIWLPGIDGLETLEKIRQLEDPPEVVIISGHGTIETAFAPLNSARLIFWKSRFRSTRRSSC